MDSHQGIYLQIWEGTKDPILITIFDPISQQLTHTAHSESPEFCKAHSKAVVWKDSPANSSSVSVWVFRALRFNNKEAIVYISSPLWRLFLPQWVAGYLQRKKTATFIDLFVDLSTCPTFFDHKLFSLQSCTFHLRSQRDFCKEANGSWWEERGEVGWSRDEGQGRHLFNKRWFSSGP